MPKKLEITILTGLLCSSVALAVQTPPQASSLTLTVTDAVKTALDRNPDVLSYRERLIEAEKNISFVKAQAFPNLSLFGSATRQKEPVLGSSAAFGGEAFNSYLAQLRLNQPLYVGGAVTSGVSAADKELDIRRKDLEILERNITLQVIESFYTVLANQQLLNLLQQLQKVEQQSLQTEERYYRLGRAQLLDVLQSKTQLALLLPRITTISNQMTASVSQLTTLLHENQAKTVTLLGPVAYIDPQVVTTYLNKRKELPEISRGQEVINQFEDKSDVQMAVHKPTLNLVGTFGRQSNAQTDLLNDYSTAWTVGLQLSIPLFSGLSSKYQRAALTSQQSQLEYGQMKLLDTLSYNQIQAERDLNVATAVLKSSKEASDYSQSAMKEAQRELRVQTINYVQLLSTQQNFLDAQSTFIQAKYSYIDSVAKYFVASGIPIVELIQLINSNH